ncbi:hypothetical protein [Umezawaea sp. NPDC059074]|uniref:hypothetical protein n=1 Tax=Umezawaea sp. NPDC059074 TaxID=3346716 RepID=UPI00368D293D
MIAHRALDRLFQHVLCAPVTEPSRVFEGVLPHMYAYVPLADPLQDLSSPVYEQLSVVRHYIAQSDLFDLLIRMRGRQVHVMVPAHIPLGEATLLLHSAFRTTFGDLAEPIPKATLGFDFGETVGDIAGVAHVNPGLIESLYVQQSQPPLLSKGKGKDWRDTRAVLSRAVPALTSAKATCPACPPCDRLHGYAFHCVPCQHVGVPLAQVIIHLNDHHRWARAAPEAQPGDPNTADWLEEYAAANGIDLRFKMPDESEMTK